MLYEFELGHNATEATKRFCCVKSEGLVDYCKVTRYFARVAKSSMFRQDLIDFNAWISKPCSKPKKNIRRVEIGEYQVAYHLDLDKNIRYQIVANFLTHSSTVSNV